ncbi:hypothetical protein HOO68_00610 [Candidatus Gracilibacteria bacterium]|nr:hypothetical protein [Candidatus Gracilibacteria bacterium]
MVSPILFRSLRSGYDRSGLAHSSIKQRGLSWSHLRQYNDTDDIRDIAWTKIRPDGLSVRVRESHGDFEIISYWGNTPYDNFFETNKNTSKAYSIKNLRNSISISAKFGGHPYREFFGDTTNLKNLSNSKPRNALIFICNINPSEIPKSLAFHNDLIYIDLIHPFEENPHTSILFEGKVINTKLYLKSYLSYKEEQKNNIKKIRASYIHMSTQDDITNTLNSFFKKRYNHG